jgi:hypothetical protein
MPANPFETWTTEVKDLIVQYFRGHQSHPSESSLAEEELLVALESLASAPFRRRPPRDGVTVSMPVRALESFPLACVLTTPAGIIQRANRAARDMLICQNLIGHPLLVFIAKEKRRAFLEDWAWIRANKILFHDDWPVMLQPVKAPARPAALRFQCIPQDGLPARLMWVINLPS